MKSTIILATVATLACLALGQSTRAAEIIVHVGGGRSPQAARYNYARNYGGRAVQPAYRGRAHYGANHNDFHPYPGRGYARRPANYYPRHHYFYEWQTPYYGFRSNSAGNSYGYGY